MKEFVVKLVKAQTGLSRVQIDSMIEVPPKDSMGDFSFACFRLPKLFEEAGHPVPSNKNPLVIAEDLCKTFRKKLPKEISNVESLGGYVNFFVDKEILLKRVLKNSFSKDWGSLKLDNRKVGIEYPGPNTNKALHIGHLRNISIGESISKINKAVGNKVYHLNIYNDRGILICKSMIAYEKYASGKTPASENVKGDKFVGDLYARFSKESEKNKDLEILAQEKLKLWEAGDKKTLALWKKMNSWTYKGMQETFDVFGLSKIDKNYYESEMYKHGKEIVATGLKKGLFKKKEGAVVIDLEKEKLGEKVLLRADGTSLYVTQDLYLAEKRVKDFKLDSSYYVVGNDQDYHFKVLFSILDKLGLKKDLRHLSYGMVALPTGKMKSREGTAVSADELISNTQELARKGLTGRGTELSKKELEERSLKISLAAIKYTLLKVDIRKKIIFNPKEALSFEGDTGPYLLYSYARANSILKKVNGRPKVKIMDMKDSEIRLLKKIDSFEGVVERAYRNLSPNLIANYSFELAQMFNEFYHACPVLGSVEEGFRLKLTEAFSRTLKRSLELLGIETLEEM